VGTPCHIAAGFPYSIPVVPIVLCSTVCSTGSTTTACNNRNSPAYAGGGIWVVEPSAKLFADLMDFIAKPIPGTKDTGWHYGVRAAATACELALSWSEAACHNGGRAAATARLHAVLPCSRSQHTPLLFNKLALQPVLIALPRPRRTCKL